MLMLKTFQEKTFRELEEKFNFFMDAAKPPKVVNISFHSVQGAEPAITVLWDDTADVQAIHPPFIMSPGLKRN